MLLLRVLFDLDQDGRYLRIDGDGVAGVSMTYIRLV